MSDRLDPLYRQNQDYQPLHDGTFWILSDAEGWGLAFDEPVYRVWSSFDGRPTEKVVAEVSSQSGVSQAFAQSTAKVLARAGMLLPSQPLPSLKHEPSADVSDLNPFPQVSIIILASRQARVHLESCLPSVQVQSYPNLEVILVDNQTTDDSAEFARREYPQVRVLSTPEPMGFAGANNWAMEQARGEFFFLVNEATEMEPDCIAECMRVMLGSAEIAVVAPKMKLFYMRDFYNSMGNSTHADGNSHDNYIGYLDVGQFDDTEQVFTACFGAALLRRSVVKDIGYMDEEFFVYYSDTDWSYRARIGGYDVVAAPRAVIYHKFTATIGAMASTFKLGLVIYSRLRFAWKNLDFRRACRFLGLYFKGDIGGYLWAKQNGMKDAMATYRQTRLKWLRSLPEVTQARRRTRRRQRPPFSDDKAFALAAQAPRPAMYGKYPVLAAPFIRNHYMSLQIFSPESAPGPEDLAPVDAAQPPSPLSLVGRGWHVLREKGVRGFMAETHRYFLWRIMPK